MLWAQLNYGFNVLYDVKSYYIPSWWKSFHSVPEQRNQNSADPDMPGKYEENIQSMYDISLLQATDGS